MQLQGSLEAHTYKKTRCTSGSWCYRSNQCPSSKRYKKLGLHVPSRHCLFRVGSIAATLMSSLECESPIAGSSWCLVIRKRPPKNLKKKHTKNDTHLSFIHLNCPGAWCGTLVNVTISFPSHPKNPSLCTTSIAVVLDGNGFREFPLISCLADDLGHVLVSLEVTFTNPLTYDIFDVLRRVGRVPDAPATAGAAETRVPHACSALRALEQSLKTGTSFDIIFQVYTRRLSPGKVTRPIPIYASTAVLQTATLLPDFSEEDLDFSDLFEMSEGDTLPFTSTESYEYESDSDLDDDDDDNLATGDEASACHDERSHTPVDNAESHEVNDTGSISSFSSIEEQPGNRTLLVEGVEIVPAVTDENLKRGSRVVLVKGVAWRTWHAFIYYCYTGIVNFASLRSQGTLEAAHQQSRLKDGPPHCSPKSIYQLARKLHNEPLSQLALKAIEIRLSTANILDEAFSKFTSRHDAVREMQVALLVKHRNASEVLQGLPTKIEAMGMGNAPHAVPVLTTYCQQIAQIFNSNHQNGPKPESKPPIPKSKVDHRPSLL
ncbi:uncharacterized protein EDB91DRAFT_616278 [Suillus paluster]|uniref:uncharacterized protein n=1 Tax=Suillus paluster TaxID=48578 RepID=UPI001B8795A0|nr:uncharacterized protein EDB91DRAFT_616278 [Suillus paluster]KAG1751624.1 hypothetical protein EDB91DRAFT_616278 [Suillus paluster]